MKETIFSTPNSKLIFGIIFSLALSACGGNSGSSAPTVLQAKTEQNTTSSNSLQNTSIENDYSIVDLLQLPSEPVNLATNGDLEMGSTQGWHAEGDTTQLDLSIDEKYEGEYALLAHGIDRGARELSYDLSNLEFDSTLPYEFSVSIKANLETTLRFSFLYETNGVESVRSLTSYAVGSEWDTASFIVPANSSYLTDVENLLLSAENTSNIVLDDLKISYKEEKEETRKKSSTQTVQAFPTGCSYEIIYHNEQPAAALDPSDPDCVIGKLDQSLDFENTEISTIEPIPLESHIFTQKVGNHLVQICYNDNWQEIDCDTLQKPEQTIIPTPEKLFSSTQSQCPILAYKTVGGGEIIAIYPPTHPACPP